MSVNAADFAIVIRTRNEAGRLRLVLASLETEVLSEVIVIDDGSTDDTQAVLADAALRLRLRAVRNETAQGRAAASNAGARLARSELLLFLDGDVLAGPGLIAAHAAAHSATANAVVRGETWHLRCTRLLSDPDAGIAFDSEAAAFARRPVAEQLALRVTVEQVRHDFAAIEARAEPGIYPGAGPRRLHEVEMEALRNAPTCTTLWAAASGHNLSVRRSAFLFTGGFDKRIDINEHRELALRLRNQGFRMALADGARSYHLTHRAGWRDPLVEAGWESIFHATHPSGEVALLPVMWASLRARSPVSSSRMRIDSLVELQRAASELTSHDIDRLRRSHGLRSLLSEAQQ